jgi:decaprenylphospho-beta-D-erythro-pentofuranosid-2-ulose 2-reductase
VPGHQPDRIESAVVFGGTSEIALATLDAIAERGLRRVVLAVRDPAAAHGTRALTRHGVAVDVVRFDADDDPDAHAAAVDAAVGILGRVDLALVAFGVLGDQERAKRDPAAAVALVRTNLAGAVSVLTILADRMRRRGHGTIAVLSSVAAIRARRANYPYGATKAGLDAFAQGLGDDLAGSGVRVAVIRPGWVRTKMTERRRRPPLASDPPQIAAEIARGLERGAHTIWAPRSLRWVFAAMRVLPRPLWRRIRD